MRVVALIASLGSVCFALGCQRGERNRASPTSTAATDEAAHVSVPAPAPAPATAAPAPAEAEPAPAADSKRVTLPKSPNTPPRRTVRPLARAELQRLAAIEFKDFDREDRGLTARSTEVRYTTQTRPKLGVTVS